MSLWPSHHVANLCIFLQPQWSLISVYRLHRSCSRRMQTTFIYPFLDARCKVVQSLHLHNAREEYERLPRIFFAMHDVVKSTCCSPGRSHPPPCPRRTQATFEKPFCDARGTSGVQPLPSRAFASAPCSRRMRTMSRYPFCDAQCICI